jgi:hypothetical protein
VDGTRRSAGDRVAHLQYPNEEQQIQRAEVYKACMVAGSGYSASRSSDLNHTGFPAGHFRVLDGSNAAGLPLCYSDLTPQELRSHIGSPAI